MTCSLWQIKARQITCRFEELIREKMKQTEIVFIALALISNVAKAQQNQLAKTLDNIESTNISIYGVLDGGARYADGLSLSATSSPTASNSTTSGFANGIDRSGRFGFTGKGDLGDGYKALFTLESDVYLNTGSTNPNLGTGKDTSARTTNKIFERQATVGLATPYGQFLLGRQQSAIRDIIDDIDAIGGRFTAFNPNLQYTSLNASALVSSATTYYGAGNPGNDSMMRQDRAVKYIANTGPVTEIVVYSFGGVTGLRQASSSIEGALSYSDDTVILSTAYQELNNINDSLKLSAYTAGGRYSIGDWQFAANYGHNRADRMVNEQIKTNIYSIGTTYAITSSIDLTVGYYNVGRSWTANAKPDASIRRIIGFAEYRLSKKTLLFLELDKNKWGGDVTQFQGASINKASTSGLSVGIDYKI